MITVYGIWSAVVTNGAWHVICVVQGGALPAGFWG